MKFFVLKILKKVQKERKDHKDTTARPRRGVPLEPAVSLFNM